MLRSRVKAQIFRYGGSRFSEVFCTHEFGPLAIKFISSFNASNYIQPNALNISQSELLTWGNATYVSPLTFPLSGALYGRVGVVSRFSPDNWQMFDARDPKSIQAYLDWALNEPEYRDLLLTVHSTFNNHLMRNKFRDYFKIDCVLFHPDQVAVGYTNPKKDVWMAVSDWDSSGCLMQSGHSNRLNAARVVVLVEEEFATKRGDLPLQVSEGFLEQAIFALSGSPGSSIHISRSHPALQNLIASQFVRGNLVYVSVEL